MEQQERKPKKKRSKAEKMAISIFVILLCCIFIPAAGLGVAGLIFAIFKLLPDLWNDKM